MEKICAIHQPNFLPRLSTLAKILSADVWIILDDVQFCRRDYQHRAKLASPATPHLRHWLTLPVHLPDGRRTEIRRVELADTDKLARRVSRMLAQDLGTGLRWAELQHALNPAVKQIEESRQLCEVAELSTRVLLDMVGWQGEIVRSSEFEVRQERSARLADLTEAVRAKTYLCGSGGRRYLDEAPFMHAGISVRYFEGPRWLGSGVWHSGRDLSAVYTLSEHTLRPPNAG